MCENSFCENIQIQFGKIIFPIEWQMWRLHFLKRQSLLCHLHQWRYKNITLWKPHESLMRWHHIHCYNGFCPSQFVGGGYLLIHTSWYITNNIGLRSINYTAVQQTAVSMLTYFWTTNISIFQNFTWNVWYFTWYVLDVLDIIVYVTKTKVPKNASL